MKEFLILAIAVFSAVTIQAQPIAQNRTIFGPPGGFATPLRGSLSRYVQGGNPPYTFNLVGQAQNGNVTLDRDNGNFSISPDNFPASFQYTASDSRRQTSAPATVTIVPGPLNTGMENGITEKG